MFILTVPSCFISFNSVFIYACLWICSFYISASCSFLSAFMLFWSLLCEFFCVYKPHTQIILVSSYESFESSFIFSSLNYYLLLCRLFLCALVFNFFCGFFFPSSSLYFFLKKKQIHFSAQRVCSTWFSLLSAFWVLLLNHKQCYRRHTDQLSMPSGDSLLFRIPGLQSLFYSIWLPYFFGAV